MKLYTAQAPNPFRVKAFLAEKGVEIPTEIISVMDGSTRQPDFLKINSLGELPVLELDDGSYLTESIAICRYLEAQYPDTPLMGTTPLEAARIEMWNRRMEQQVFGPAGAYGLHVIPFFADKIEQLPAYAETQKSLLAKKWVWLNDELSDGRTYIVDDAFSIADITGMAALVVGGFLDLSIPEGLEHVTRWEQAVRARPVWES